MVLSRRGPLIRPVLVFLTLMLAASCPLPGQTDNSPLTPASGSYLDAGGVKLWYEECGAATNAASVVLLHDGLIHSTTWDEEWGSLCAQYHVVRYDRRGYGRSEPSKSAFVPEDDVVRVMRQAHMPTAFVVGCSSGGGLALDFALAHPEMVDGLFLIGPVVHGMASSAYFNERGAKNNEPLNRNDIKGVAENWSKDRFLIFGDHADARKKIYETLLHNPQNLKVSGGLEIRPSPPAVTRLGQIHALTKIVVGEADIADVMAYSGAILAALPLATFEVWSETGHLVQLERPKELVAALGRVIVRASRKEVSVAARTLEGYAGRYKFFDSTATVRFQDNRLVLEIPGNPYYWLFAASDIRFFARTLGSEIEFHKDSSGKVAEMVIFNGDQQIRCPRT